MEKSSSSTSSATGSNSSGRELSAAAPGCGSSDLGTIPLATPPPPPPPISLNITTTTGGSFTVLVDAQNSVENLKKIIAKKLKVAKDRICLLHRERELQGGNLKDNGLVDGSKVILIPNVETGLLAQRPENTVMQALESLNDAQVNDFLSGKTPLNLSMRLGDHMMLIQLQLSTVNPSSPSHTSSRSRSSQRSSSSKTSTSLSSASTANNSSSGTQHAIRKLETDTNSSRHNNSSSLALDPVAPVRLSNSLQETPTVGVSAEPCPVNNTTDSGPSIVRSLSVPQPMPSTSGKIVAAPSNATEESRTLPDCCSSLNSTSFSHESLLEQSPIKSLSNLVSSPIKTTSITNIPTMTSNFSASDSNSTPNDDRQLAVAPTSSPIIAPCSDPISAKLTSCLCKRLSNSTRNCDLTQCQTRQEVPLASLGSPCGNAASTSELCSRRIITTSTPNAQQSVLKQAGNPAFLHKTANNPIVRSKHHRHHHHHHSHHHHHHYTSAHGNGVLRKSTTAEKSRPSTSAEATGSTATTSDNTSSETSFDLDESMTAISATDSRALAEASRNLTQTLRKLSKEVFTSKVDLSEEAPRKNGSGAVIESMKNHGKGIYSGTFSGTLNPALQDRYGRPKRDISTVIHILNDLLSATPQYSKGARICFESPSTSKSGKIRTSTSSDACNKCLNSAKSTNCVYGECNGHYSGGSSTSSPAQITCHRNTAIASDSCSCCGQDSGVSFDASQSLTPSECSSSVSSFSDLNSLSTSSSCTCSFLKTNKASTNESPNISLQDVSTNTTVDKPVCSKCVAEFQNNKTKCKLDQLRLVMQQSKQRREARKLKGAPYGARVLSTSTSASNGTPSTSPSVSSASSASASATAAGTIAPLASPSEVSPGHIVEEVNTVA